MSDLEHVVGDPTEVLTRSGGSSYVSLGGLSSAAEGDAYRNPEADVTAEAPEKRRSSLIGWLALAVAAIAGVLTGVGVSLAAGGDYIPGTAVAWVAIVLSGAAVLAGILAVVAGFGRMPGAIAIPLALLANPYLLTRLLEVASAATT